MLTPPKLRRVTISLALSLSLSALSLPLLAESSAAAPTAAAASLKQQILQGKRIVFLGDSITAGAGYVIGVAQTLKSMRLPNGGPEVLSAGLSSETVSGLSEEGHGGAGEKAFPRPYLFERLTRVLDLLKPDTVFACYGINCGIYQPFDDARFQAFKDGMERLHNEVEKTGARIIHITPPFFDATRKPKQDYYPEVMLKYAAWLVSKRDAGWQVIDLHTAMKAAVEKHRQTEPNFTMSPDGIHPSVEGHWLMARQVLGWLGDTEAANSPTAESLLETRRVPSEVAKLIAQRVSLTRDSYVQTAGHKRPGTTKGLPLEEAQTKAAEIDKQLDSLLAK
ncbi:MAG: SGNH/GDSL hydrolase family protein [Verrucomicrobiota bacterium]